MPALRLHAGLAGTRRIPSLSKSETTTTAEWVALLSMGVVTGCVATLVDLHLRVPGHAILKSVFLVAAGLALVPRRGAGSVIAASALVTALGLRLGGGTGAGFGIGALTSMTAVGPVLDAVLRRAQSNRGIYLGFMTAGLVSNLIALLVRGAAKALGFEHAGGRPLASWLGQSVVTYTICGLLAGLLSAAVWFCLRPRADRAPKDAP